MTSLPVPGLPAAPPNPETGGLFAEPQRLPNPHRVEWTIERDRIEASFTCSAPAGADCRMTCSVGCEEWDPGDHEHPLADNGQCLYIEFLNDDPDFAAELFDCDGPVPLVSGPVEFEWLGDHYRWSYPVAESSIGASS